MGARFNMFGKAVLLLFLAIIDSSFSASDIWRTLGIKLATRCLAPLQRGTCQDSIQRFYFDAKQHRCTPFIYTGCGNNGNNFKTHIECVQSCHKSVPISTESHDKFEEEQSELVYSPTNIPQTKEVRKSNDVSCSYLERMDKKLNNLIDLLSDKTYSVQKNTGVPTIRYPNHGTENKDERYSRNGLKRTGGHSEFSKAVIARDHDRLLRERKIRQPKNGMRGCARLPDYLKEKNDINPWDKIKLRDEKFEHHIQFRTAGGMEVDDEIEEENPQNHRTFKFLICGKRSPPKSVITENEVFVLIDRDTSDFQDKRNDFRVWFCNDVKNGPEEDSFNGNSRPKRKKPEEVNKRPKIYGTADNGETGDEIKSQEDWTSSDGNEHEEKNAKKMALYEEEENKQEPRKMHVYHKHGKKEVSAANLEYIDPELPQEPDEFIDFPEDSRYKPSRLKQQKLAHNATKHHSKTEKNLPGDFSSAKTSTEEMEAIRVPTLKEKIRAYSHLKKTSEKVRQKPTSNRKYDARKEKLYHKQNSEINDKRNEFVPPPSKNMAKRRRDKSRISPQGNQDSYKIFSNGFIEPNEKEYSKEAESGPRENNRHQINPKRRKKPGDGQLKLQRELEDNKIQYRSQSNQEISKRGKSISRSRLFRKAIKSFSCSVGNTTLKKGELWLSEDGCKECLCFDPPKFTCESEICPPPPSESAYCEKRFIPGQCCPDYFCVFTDSEDTSVDACQGVICKEESEICEMQSNVDADGKWLAPVGVCVPNSAVLQDTNSPLEV